MELHSASVIETNGKRYVEMVFTDGSHPDQSDEHLTFRLAVDAGRYPRIPAAQLEALQHVRDVVTNEIQRIERIRGQVHPNEDWRK